MSAPSSHEHALSTYRALLEKVDTWTARTTRRRPDAYACQRGCSACCAVELSVCDVEAENIRAHLRSLLPDARAAIAEVRSDIGPTRCAFLDPNGSCSVYPVRPLVCRTQGFALRYSNGLVPLAAVRGRASGGEVTHCPLNFNSTPFASEDVLDAERVDLMLALTNRAFSSDPERRTTLRDLAREQSPELVGAK